MSVPSAATQRVLVWRDEVLSAQNNTLVPSKSETSSMGTSSSTSSSERHEPSLRSRKASLLSRLKRKLGGGKRHEEGRRDVDRTEMYRAEGAEDSCAVEAVEVENEDDPDWVESVGADERKEERLERARRLLAGNG